MQRVNGFYGHIQRNNLRSVVMFLGFALACQLIGIAVLFAPLMFMDPYHAPVFDFYGYLERYGVPVFLGTLLLFFVRFFLHVKHIKQDLNFHLVTQIQEARLCKIVEIQAIGAGISMPQVAIIEDDARNAFACGMNERSAVVVVTRGLLRSLDDEELEAVVAHEITHIVNGDIRMLAVANVMLSTLFLVKKYNPLKIRGAKSFILFLVLPVLLILVLLSGLVTSIALTLGMLTKLIIASSREFIADAEAVRMTKNPAALISALRRIEGHSDIEGLDETLDAMMIDGAVEGTYANHPTIAERIAALTQHAGAMAFGADVRKDTRTLADLGPGIDGGFGRRIQRSAKTNAEPKKGLIGRVNAGSSVDAFGLTKKKRYVVIAVLLVPMLFSGYALVSGSTPAHKRLWTSIKSGEFFEKKKSSSRPGRNDPEVIARKARVKALREMDPLKARCFAGLRYSIGDLGLRDFKMPDSALVTKIVSDPKRRLLIEVETYAAIHIKTNRAVNGAPNTKTRIKALGNYVGKRMHTLAVMHRTFGDAGFEWMHETYESDSDKKIVESIKEKLASGVAIGKSSREKRHIALLVDNSRDFIPCFARDQMMQTNRSKAPKTAAIPNDALRLSADIIPQ